MKITNELTKPLIVNNVDPIINPAKPAPAKDRGNPTSDFNKDINIIKNKTIGSPFPNQPKDASLDLIRKSPNPPILVMLYAIL